MNEESLFVAALERPTPAARQAFLDAACGDDTALRHRVERLLAAHGGPSGILEHGPAPTDLPAAPLEAGCLFAGRFVLRQKLGAGGMGEVWVADQTTPVQRRVALKLVRPGLASAHLLARFEQERQALALMDHPNIARVLDAGEADGRPYFVMELIKGVPITEYCDAAKLTPRQRLELFIPVCQAVQHAHQKGIIHRDIKPANILVAPYDGVAVPKVIDFGIAKATGSRLTEQSVYTEVGSLIGTLEYMSPEQAELSNLDIDTRSDIYSLGVVLYELLTGTVPFSRKELQSVSFLEMLRLIREVEPSRPSTKLSLAATVPAVAARRSEPKRLAALVRGELDWVVMKCLEKDRARRYETASGLVRDIGRYLADEVVEARPPSAGYRLRKFVQRNRGPALAAALVLLALVAGVAGTTAGLVRAVQARRAEQLAKEKAQRSLDQVQRGINALASIFQDLDPRAEEKEGKPLRAILADRLDGASAALEGEAVGDPLVVARLQGQLGQAYLGLGQAAKAEALFARALATSAEHLGEHHIATLERMDRLALAYREGGKINEAIALYERVRDLKGQSPEADDDSKLSTLLNLGTTYFFAGRHHEAIALLEEVRDADVKRYRPDDPRALATLNNLVFAYTADRRFTAAIALGKRVLAAFVKKHGEAHPHSIGAMGNLGDTYRARGSAATLKQALALFEKARALAELSLGPLHPHTLRAQHNVAEMYRVYEKTPEAIALLEQVRERRTLVHGPDHPATLNTLVCLAGAYRKAGKQDEALALFQQAAAGVEKHRYVLGNEADRIIRDLCQCHEDRKEYNQAEVWWRKWLPVAKTKYGPGSVAYAEAMGGLGRCLLRQNKYADAEPVLRECLAICRKQQAGEWAMYRAHWRLGAALLGQKKYADAEPHLVKACEGMRGWAERLGPSHASSTTGPLTEALRQLVQLYDATNNPTEAAKWRKELEARTKGEGRAKPADE